MATRSPSREELPVDAASEGLSPRATLAEPAQGIHAGSSSPLEVPQSGLSDEKAGLRTPKENSGPPLRSTSRSPAQNNNHSNGVQSGMHLGSQRPLPVLSDLPKPTDGQQVHSQEHSARESVARCPQRRPVTPEQHVRDACSERSNGQRAMPQVYAGEGRGLPSMEEEALGGTGRADAGTLHGTDLYDRRGRKAEPQGELQRPQLGKQEDEEALRLLTTVRPPVTANLRPRTFTQHVVPQHENQKQEFQNGVTMPKFEHGLTKPYGCGSDHDAPAVPLQAPGAVQMCESQASCGPRYGQQHLYQHKSAVASSRPVMGARNQLTHAPGHSADEYPQLRLRPSPHLNERFAPENVGFENHKEAERSLPAEESTDAVQLTSARQTRARQTRRAAMRKGPSRKRDLVRDEDEADQLEPQEPRQPALLHPAPVFSAPDGSPRDGGPHEVGGSPVEYEEKAACVEQGSILALSWDEMAAQLEEFYRVNGVGAVPSPTSNLGVWIATQRLEKRHNLIPDDRMQRLTRAGIEWAPHWSGVSWCQRYAELLDFYKRNGHCRVRYSGGGLGGWVSTQRRAYKYGRLSAERTAQLDAIHFIWDARPDAQGRQGGPPAIAAENLPAAMPAVAQYAAPQASAPPSYPPALSSISNMPEDDAHASAPHPYLPPIHPQCLPQAPSPQQQQQPPPPRPPPAQAHLPPPPPPPPPPQQHAGFFDTGGLSMLSAAAEQVSVARDLEKKRARDDGTAVAAVVRAVRAAVDECGEGVLRHVRAAVDGVDGGDASSADALPAKKRRRTGAPDEGQAEWRPGYAAPDPGRTARHPRVPPLAGAKADAMEWDCGGPSPTQVTGFDGAPDPARGPARQT